MAHVFDWKSGKEIFRVGPTADFECFSADGKKAFITRSQEIGTQIWDVGKAEVVNTVPEINGCLSLSPDGKHFAHGWPGKGIFLADLTGLKPSKWWHSKDPVGMRVAFSPDGKILANASSDQVVHLWSVAEEREIGRLLGHVDAVTDVAFSPDGKLLATSGMDHRVHLWPAESKKQTTVISNTWPPYVISPDATRLAARFADDVTLPHELHVWDLASLQSVVLDKSKNPPKPEFFSRDSQTLFARAEVMSNGVLPLLRWDLEKPGRAPRSTLLKVNKATEVLGTAITQDRLTYAVGQLGTRRISLWDPIEGKNLGKIHLLIDKRIGPPYQFSPSGQKLLTLAPWRNLSLIDRNHPERFLSLRFPSNRIRDIAFSPDGKLLAVAGEDHSITLLDAASLEKVGVLLGHQQGLLCLAFSPDGKTLASSSYGGMVKLWSLPARREAAILMESEADFCFLAFSPDGNTLVAGGWARTHIFRVRSLAEIDAMAVPFDPL